MSSSPHHSTPDRRTARDGSGPASASRTAGPLPTHVRAADVVLLQHIVGAPCVTLLLATTPGRRPDADARARLARLYDSARARLVELAHLPDAAAADERLVELIEQAHQLPTDQAMAVFASADHSQILTLPITVTDRVVVDPTFATRDLVRALHRTPRHVVLVLAKNEARLLESQGGVLVPAGGSKFPMRGTPGERAERAGADQPSRSGRGAGEPDSRFLAAVDQALGAYLKVHPQPVILAGAEPTVSTFRTRSRHLSRLAGVVRGNHLRTSTARLAELAAPHLEGYLASREREALDLLQERLGQGRAMLGIDAAWLVARWGLPEMVAVEHDFVFPARLTDDGNGLVAADDPDGPDVVDDIVDEVIEIVLLRGGWVAFVEPGQIPGQSRIALTLKSR